MVQGMICIAQWTGEIIFKAHRSLFTISLYKSLYYGYKKGPKTNDDVFSVPILFNTLSHAATSLIDVGDLCQTLHVLISIDI